ncbi:MAG: glycosyltransferase family 2 protein [Flavobacteriia bacterium]|nr:glycosyltransferase family 2 protein [Flavobacteriia bacterium]
MISAIKCKKNSENAPVGIFAYNRPIHLKTCWQALAKNPEAEQTDLIVFSDGWKTGLDKSFVEEVRVEIGRINGFRSVQSVLQKENLGLSQSVCNGVSSVLSKEEAVIVVEDDIEVCPFFLKYMNEATSLYRDHSEVASIHGYIYPCKQILPETFFMKGADCWGWATWRSAWKKFEPDGSKLLEQLRSRKLEKEFDLEGVGPFTGMLQQQIQGKNDSWAIRWHASAFLAGMHTLYPGR